VQLLALVRMRRSFSSPTPLPQHVGFGPHLFEPSDDPRSDAERALLRDRVFR
jgi:hypothetical protein